MESILEAINEWIKEILIGAINGNLSTMFGDVNEKVGTIAAEVGKTPQGWNANIFNMIQNLSENVIVPIAGLVITYVLCYELISMVKGTTGLSSISTSHFPLKRTIRRQQGRGFPVLKQTYSIILRCLGYRRTPYPAMNA